MSQLRAFHAHAYICKACIKAIEADLKAWLGYISFRITSHIRVDNEKCVRCERFVREEADLDV